MKDWYSVLSDVIGESSVTESARASLQQQITQLRQNIRVFLFLNITI